METGAPSSPSAGEASGGTVKCELRTSVAASAEASGPALSSDGNPSMPWTPTPGASSAFKSRPGPDGGPALPPSAEASRTASRPAWMEAWISSQRGFLAAIFPLRDAGQGLMEPQPDQPTPDASEQLTFGGLDGSFLRTPRKSGRGAEAKLLPILWRGDTAGETEALRPLLWALRTSESDGLCSRTGPTLLASDGPKGGPNGRGAKGDLKLPAWLHHLCKRTLSTLCATDYKIPYSAEGYQAQADKRSKPLRDTAAPGIGIPLTPTFAEWWMGWPLGSTVPVESKPLAMPGSRSKRRRPGASSGAPVRNSSEAEGLGVAASAEPPNSSSPTPFPNLEHP